MTTLPAPSPIRPRAAETITAIPASSAVDGSRWARPSGPTDQERAAHAQVLSSIAALSSDFPRAGIEGSEHVQTATRRERNPNLRAGALRVHGASCRRCAFNFQATYGTSYQDLLTCIMPSRFPRENAGMTLALTASSFARIVTQWCTRSGALC